MIVSAAVGYFTIKFFLRFLGGHKLDVFAAYRLLLAAATVVWLMHALRSMMQWLRRQLHRRVLRDRPAGHQRRRPGLDLPAGRRIAVADVCDVARP